MAIHPFLSDNTGTPSIYVLAVADGKPQGQPLLVKRNAGPLQITSMTKDGTLFYSVWTEWGSEGFTVDLDPARGAITSEPQPLSGRFSPRREFAAWSPDGRRLAILAGRTTQGDHRDDPDARIRPGARSSPCRTPTMSGGLRSLVGAGRSALCAYCAAWSLAKTESVHSVSTATGAVTRIPAKAVILWRRHWMVSLLISVLDPTSHRAAVIRHDGHRTGNRADLAAGTPLGSSYLLTAQG
jgi:hypothetical protein